MVRSNGKRMPIAVPQLRGWTTTLGCGSSVRISCHQRRCSRATITQMCSRGTTDSARRSASCSNDGPPLQRAELLRHGYADLQCRQAAQPATATRREHDRPGVYPRPSLQVAPSLFVHRHVFVFSGPPATAIPSRDVRVRSTVSYPDPNRIDLLGSQISDFRIFYSYSACARSALSISAHCPFDRCQVDNPPKRASSIDTFDGRRNGA